MGLFGISLVMPVTVRNVQLEDGDEDVRRGGLVH